MVLRDESARDSLEKSDHQELYLVDFTANEDRPRR